MDQEPFPSLDAGRSDLPGPFGLGVASGSELRVRVSWMWRLRPGRRCAGIPQSAPGKADPLGAGFPEVAVGLTGSLQSANPGSLAFRGKIGRKLGAKWVESG